MIDLKRSGVQLVEGPVGAVEVLLDQPRGPRAGVAVVAHPQPLLGGSAQHKVPQFLARGLADAGWLVLRPNFRGVGRSAGVHSAGEGETEDLFALAHALQTDVSVAKLALVGFSFGAFVQARVARRLADAGQPAWRVALVGTPCGDVEGGRTYDTPDGIANALVVHGELDAQVPLRSVFDWARPQGQPVVVVPGADHFFSGKLHLLRSLVVGHVSA
jgi:hypothetical protein